MLTNQNGASSDDLHKQIATLRADVAKLTASAADDVKDGLGAARRQALKSGRDAREGVVDAVTEHPLTAIGIAGGVGYLLGILTRR